MYAVRLPLFALLLLPVLIAGCQQANPPATNNGDHDHAHAHPSHGPHEGELIELGNEDYHAELIHDEKAGTVTIYLLDGHAEKPVAIDAAEITFNFQRDGQLRQFKLAASPDAGDGEGKASRFVSSEAALVEVIDSDGPAGQLVVTIEGKQYRGTAQHDHEGHAH